ncbi:uncharacterized protein G2W53_033283 [Senna tora]|uniref:Uncharacterized protein n=1 Tax=Senna tora TaxID=362788 RepID=A0A834SZU7_9FABA|nr:uncharacterized protein G2W53_033283 [Senna tora]
MREKDDKRRDARFRTPSFRRKLAGETRFHTLPDFNELQGNSRAHCIEAY